MKNLILGLLLGFGAGGIATSLILKKKIQKKADEEIQSVIDSFKDLSDKKKAKNTETKNPDREYIETVDTDDFDEENNDRIRKLRKEKDEEIGQMIEIISPEEFGNYADDGIEYDEEVLTLYSDGVLADIENEVFNDVPRNIGVKNLKKMGIYSPDMLHIRNHRLHMDIEIHRVDTPFSEIRKTMHYTE